MYFLSYKVGGGGEGKGVASTKHYYFFANDFT